MCLASCVDDFEQILRLREHYREKFDLIITTEKNSNSTYLEKGVNFINDGDIYYIKLSE